MVLRINRSLWEKTSSRPHEISFEAENPNPRKRKPSLSIDCSSLEEYCGTCGELGSCSCMEESDYMIPEGHSITTKIRPFLSFRDPNKKYIDESIQTPVVLAYLRNYISTIPEDVRNSILLDLCNLSISTGTSSSSSSSSSLTTALSFGKGNQVHPTCPNELSTQLMNPITGNMTLNNITTHMVSLRIDAIQRQLRPLLQKLMNHPRNLNAFNKPVDPQALHLLDYLDKIKTPMDLGTVKSKLQRGVYENFQDCIADIRLVFTNAMSYNPPTHYIYDCARQMEIDFEAEVATLFDKNTKEGERKGNHSCALCMGSSCLLCGEKCLKYEPPVLVCQGSCNQRIKKNTIYYITNDGMYQWCYRCYCSLPSLASETSHNGNPIYKKNLLKRRLDEEVSEPWVHCDFCDSWIHQVCALYDDKIMVEIESERYMCSMCMLEHVGGNYLASKGLRHEDIVEGVIDTVLSKAKPIMNKSKSTANPVTPLCSVVTPAPKKRGRKPKSRASVLTTTPMSLGTSTAMTPLSFTSSSSCDDDMHDNNSPKIQFLADEHISGMSFDEEPIQPPAIVEEDDEQSDGQMQLEEHSDDTANIVSETNTTATTAAEVDSDISSESIAHTPLQLSESPDCPLHINMDSTSSEFTLGSQLRGKASHLPKSKLSDFLEEMVKCRLEETGFPDVMKSLTIRLVSNIEQVLEVPQIMVDNLMTRNGNTIPSELPYRQKCILLFQEIDGVDVCLFCLYAQEFSSSCPAPNDSTVYIAYLDSVDYFRPIEARTQVYQEIMVGYMKWVQMRGFQKCHIWSCPPQRGDNFIFWCHPPHQRTPSRDRLSSWYQSILARCAHVGIIDEVSNLYDKYFQGFAAVLDRDEHQRKQSSKSSNIGQNKTSKRSKSLGSLCDIESSSVISCESKCVDESVPNAMESVIPPCVSPPIFEGDFWVLECFRAHRTAQQRIRGYDGRDVSANLRRARESLKALMSRSLASPFNQPVDPQALNIPDYFKVITNPMDLGTVKEKLRNFQYENMYLMMEDIRLTFRNAMKFNPVGHQIHRAAETLLRDFENNITDMVIFANSEVTGNTTQLTPEEVDNQLMKYRMQHNKSDPLSNAQNSTNDDLSPNSESVRNRVQWSLDPVLSSSSSMIASVHECDGNGTGNGKMVDICRSRSKSVSSELNMVCDDDFSTSFAPERLSDASEIKMDYDDDESLATTRMQRTDSVVSAISDVSVNDWPRPMILPMMSMTRPQRSQYGKQSNGNGIIKNGHDNDNNINDNNNGDGSSLTTESVRKMGSSGSFVKAYDYIPKKFENPALGERGVQLMMAEVGRSSQRLKDDLFVVQFADPRVARSPETESPFLEFPDYETCVASIAVPPSSMSRKALLAHTLRRGLPRLETVGLGSPVLSSSLETYLEAVIPDTSDPDVLMQSPLVDTRYAFLEMSQFRHMQFDSLRRAKHSSMLLLHHLHNPYDESTRPHCSDCNQTMRDVRWHCEQCPNYDICQSCYTLRGSVSLPDSPGSPLRRVVSTSSINNSLHEHPLTPFRISYI